MVFEYMSFYLHSHLCSIARPAVDAPLTPSISIGIILLHASSRSIDRVSSNSRKATKPVVTCTSHTNRVVFVAILLATSPVHVDATEPFGSCWSSEDTKADDRGEDSGARDHFGGCACGVKSVIGRVRGKTCMLWIALKR